MQRQFRVVIGILLILALAAAGSVYGAPSANILYVRSDAAGNDDGSSWADAYTDLQDALGIAQPGDEIWVAEGVYYPAPTAIDRTATFELPDEVGIYGGFAGMETERDQRDWEANVTVLSGDLDRNDETDANEVVTDAAGITGDNAYHVVTSGRVTDTAVLDGFTITAGKADGDLSEQEIRGGGMFNDGGSPTLRNLIFSGNHAHYGGGMRNLAGHPSLDNVRFTGNHASLLGGGMHNYLGSPTLTNVSFTANRADWEGGGMYNFNRPPLDDETFGGDLGEYAAKRTVVGNSGSPVLIGVIFSANQSGGHGAGMHNRESDPTLTNVSFTGNHAAELGGGMHNNMSSPTLINVTFSGNVGYLGGGGIYGFEVSNPTLVNCILWGNYPDNIRSEDGAPATVTYSDVGVPSGVYPGTGNINQDPLFVAPVAASEAPTTMGNYRIQPASPAVDAGLNAVVPITVTTDLDGNLRIVDGTWDGNAVVDMGAYESQVRFLTVIKVGQGLVASTPDSVECGDLCTGGFLAGTEVRLTATPDRGWSFVGWSGDVESTDNPLTLIVESDMVVTATFKESVYLPLVLANY